MSGQVRGGVAGRPAVGMLALAVAMLLACLVCPSTSRAGEVVSLGDSYSSGEGVGLYDSGTAATVFGNKCHRSPLAWARQIGVTSDHHLACSGAKIENISGKGKSSGRDSQDQLTQLKAIADTTPISRVVMGIGGNDAPISFSHHLRDCVVFKCLDDQDNIVNGLPDLGSRLQRIYTQVKDAAGAPLLVVGYPDLFPSPGSPSAKNARRHCAWMTGTAVNRFARVAAAFDKTLSDAAAAAGADYVSIRDAFKGHELCTGRAWIKRLAAFDQEAGHPLKEGQLAIAERVSRWLADHRPACTAPSSIAAIVDDSGSMGDNDPDNIRSQALRLIITKPTNQQLTFGAVEFGGDAGELFPPTVIGPNPQSLLSGLSALTNNGYTDGGNTDYNEAFSVSATKQASPSARIFLTDGGHNVGSYNNAHAGGAPTYVIGLGIGPSGEGSDDADLLGRIAGETGGRYYPLRLLSSDSSQLQLSRLQPALNDIDSRISCRAVQAESTANLVQVGKRSKGVSSLFAGKPGIEAVISWADPAADVGLSSVTVRDRLGRVVGDLTGNKRVARTRRMRTKIIPNVVSGETYDTITMKRPAYGRTITLTVNASKLPVGIPVTIQVRPLDNVPTPVALGGGGGGSGAPTPPTVANLAAASPSANTVQLSADVTLTAAGAGSCRIYQDSALRETVPCSNGKFTKLLAGVPGGHHAYYLVAIDSAGGTSAASNTAQVDVASPPPPSPQTTWPETAGGVAHTWTNPANAGGTEGPTIAAFQTVLMSCKLTGFKVADGNTWWYRIAQAPWNNAYYVSADAFYNNGATSGPLKGTPFVDPAVPAC